MIVKLQVKFVNIKKFLRVITQKALVDKSELEFGAKSNKTILTAPPELDKKNLYLRYFCYKKRK